MWTSDEDWKTTTNGSIIYTLQRRNRTSKLKFVPNHPHLWYYFLQKYRQSGWLCTRWGEIAQSLNFKCLLKSPSKSWDLLFVLYNMVPLKSPQQFVGFAVTLVKIFKVKALSNLTPPYAKPPRLKVLFSVSFMIRFFLSIFDFQKWTFKFSFCWGKTR